MTFSLLLSVTATNATKEINECDYVIYKEKIARKCESYDLLGIKTLAECRASCNERQECGIVSYGRVGEIITGKGTCYLQNKCWETDLSDEHTENWGASSFYDAHVKQSCQKVLVEECEYMKVEETEVSIAVCKHSEFKGAVTLDECLSICDSDKTCGVALYGRESGSYGNTCYLQGNCINDDFDVQKASNPSSHWDAYARRCDPEAVKATVSPIPDADGKCDYKVHPKKEVRNTVCENSVYLGKKTLQQCQTECDRNELCGVALFGRKGGSYPDMCYLQTDCLNDNFNVDRLSIESRSWDAYARRCVQPDIETTVSPIPDTDLECDYKAYPNKEVRSTVCKTSVLLGEQTLQQCQTECDRNELCGVALFGRKDGITPGTCVLQTDCMYDNFNVDNVSIESRAWDAYARRCNDGSGDDAIPTTLEAELGCYWHKYPNREVWQDACKSSTFMGRLTLDECTTACEDDNNCGVAHYGITGMSAEGACFLMGDCVSDDFSPDRYSNWSKNWDVYAFRCDEGFE